ncbi:MAG: hypothetical protein NTW87_11360, partial [Planctomycetota bacterium]|nr:hypothetical protein [Planctomycetota bacterium]
EVRDGISTGFQPFPLRLIGRVEAGWFVSGDGARRPLDPRIHKKIIDGGEFHAFTPIGWAGRYIEYDKRHEHNPPHPGRPFNCQLRSPEIFDRPEKLLTRQTARGLIATVDRRRFFVRNSVHVSYPKIAWHDRGTRAAEVSLDALCACLNARFYTDYLLAVTGENGNVFPQVHIADLRCLPLLPALLTPDGELARLGAELLAGLGKARLSEAAIAARRARIEELLRAAFGLAG